MAMLVNTLPAGMIGTNCYFYYDEDTREAIVVDPGDEPERLLTEARRLELDVKYILLTHGHFDHIGALNAFRMAYPNAPVYIHRLDVTEQPTQWTLCKFDGLRYYDEGDSLPFCGGEIKVYYTPGHSKGSVCLHFGDDLFSGDTLFAGSCGRTDLPGGDMDEILRSLARLSLLPNHTRVWPGHEGASNLLREKTRNPFLREAMEL